MVNVWPIFVLIIFVWCLSCKIFILNHLLIFKQVWHDVVAELASGPEILKVELYVDIELFQVVIGEGKNSIQGGGVVLEPTGCFLHVNYWLFREELEKHGSVCIPLRSLLLTFCQNVYCPSFVKVSTMNYYNWMVFCYWWDWLLT